MAMSNEELEALVPKVGNALMDGLSAWDPNDAKGTRGAARLALRRLYDLDAVRIRTGPDGTPISDVDAVLVACVEVMGFFVDELGEQVNRDRHLFISAARDYLAGRDYDIP